MPFQRGPAPIRRTVKYLKQCPLVFKERVKVMTVNYNEEHKNQPKHTKLEQHQGARDFVFWNLQQVFMCNVFGTIFTEYFVPILNTLQFKTV